MSRNILLGALTLLLTLHGVAHGQAALPLCPGYLWQENPLSKQLSGKASQATSYFHLVSSLTTSSAISSVTIRKVALSAAPLSELKGLIELAQGQPVLPTERASWKDAQIALSALTSSERAAVFVSESNSSIGVQFGSLITKDRILTDRLMDVGVRAKVMQLARSMDPVTLEAHIGDYGDVLQNGRSLSKSSEIEVKALTLNTNRFTGETQSVLAALEGDKFVVGPGQGVQPGGLGNVPEGRSATIGLLVNGEICIRPTSKDDMKLDFSTKHIGRAWDPRGFRDVGMLLVRERLANGDVSKPEVCSFVRIGGSYAVTAAHCVLASRPGQPVKSYDFNSTTVEAYALVPKTDGSKLSPVACVTAPNDCGYVVRRLTQPPVIPEGISWQYGRAVPQPDVALIYVDFGPDHPRPQTGIAANSTKVNRLTVAGYGFTSSTDAPFVLGSLLIGWQSIDVLTDTKSIVWSVDVNGGAAGACVGDSGGAVFSGDISGIPKETHELAGIVSGGKLPRSNTDVVDRCMKAENGFATRLDQHLAWMCSASGNAILGCPSNPALQME